MRKNTARPKGRNPRQAIILTALPLEYKAARAHLTGVSKERDASGATYQRGTFECEAGAWDVVIALAGKGNVHAALKTLLGLTHVNPVAALFVGVAGGVKDAGLGDVVVATDLYGYESGKVEDSPEPQGRLRRFLYRLLHLGKPVFKPRPDLLKATFRILECATLEATEDDWRKRIIDPTANAKPDVYLGKIAAGEKVVASTRSAVYEFIRQQYSDALAVEMEGRGFLEAAWMAAPVEAIVIRGISDLLTGKAAADAGGFQDIASRHASAFAFQVLAEFVPAAPEEEEPQEPTPGQIWNVPHRRNPNFTGREEILRDLRTALTAGEAAALTQTQAIHGLGGVGKTQIAVEYAYRNQADYGVVWWVRAEEAAALAADYAALATELGLPQAGAEDQTVTIGAVRCWLEGNANWLLVFDNAPEQQAIREYVPQNPSGHVLITSRNPAWRGLATCLQVKTLPRPKAIEFLLKRTGHTDAAAADAVAEALGDLPLALEQAGAYIEETGMSLPRYLELFEAAQSEVLSRGEPSTDHPHTVATTWELSFQRVRQESAPAADLLNLCAFLAPDNVPCDMLTAGSQHVPQLLRSVLEAPLELQDAVGALRRYSLVETDDETLSFHRLVQAVTRDRMPGDDRRMWAEAAAQIVNEAFPYDSDDVRTWETCSTLLSHGLAAAGHVEELGAAREAAGRLLNQMGGYLMGRAQFTQAEAVLRRALGMAEAAYGTKHPTTAIRLSNLGLVLRDLRDPAAARECFERALTIDEATYGSDHTEVATDENNLGLVLLDLGELAGARARVERALAIYEAALGPDHPNVAKTVNNLGDVLRRLGDQAGARGCFERALAIDEAAYGPDHPNVASMAGNLGGVLRDLGDLGGAMALHERALAIQEAAYGPHHPDVAIHLNNLGSVLEDLGDLAGARAHYEQALGLFRDAFGEDHPSTVMARRNLEALDREQAA